jgi:hypothetical protein
VRCRRHPEPGPTAFREDLSRPSKADTWRATRAPCLLAHRNFEAEGLTPPSRELRGVKGVQSLGPQHSREDLSHPSEADTWRAIGVPRLLTHRNFQAEGLTPPSRDS